MPYRLSPIVPTLIQGQCALDEGQDRSRGGEVGREAGREKGWGREARDREGGETGRDREGGREGETGRGGFLVVSSHNHLSSMLRVSVKVEI